MRADITRLDLTLRRRSTIGYTIGMALYAYVIVALYPQFKDSTSLNDLTKGGSTAAALFGAVGSLTSPTGWLNANIYMNFFPLIMLLLTIGYGAAALAGQDEDGTLCLLAVLPLRRKAIVLEKTAAMVLQGALLAAAVAICVMLGGPFDLHIGIGRSIAVSASVLLMGLGFGLLAMAVGALTGKRGTALGVGSAIAAISYLISSLAPVVHWIHPLRFFSLMYWAVGDDQLTNGVSVGDWAVLLGAVVCASAATVAAFRRLDLH